MRNVAEIAKTLGLNNMSCLLKKKAEIAKMKIH